MSDSDRPTVQTANVLVGGGHQAGRDVHDQRVTNVLPQKETWVSRLNEEYEQTDPGPEVGLLIEVLRHYSDPVDAKGPLGVDKKLQLADWDPTDIDTAIRQKELFSKLLARNQLSEIAQHLIGHALCLVHSLFDARVRPLIQKKASAAELRSAAIEHVILPTLSELERNVLNVQLVELQGALYFLTGNCHVKWHE